MRFATNIYDYPFYHYSMVSIVLCCYLISGVKRCRNA